MGWGLVPPRSTAVRITTIGLSSRSPVGTRRLLSARIGLGPLPPRSLATYSVIGAQFASDGSSARVSVLNRDGGVLARFDCRGTGHGSWVDSHGDIYVGLGSPGGVDKFVRQG